MQAVDGKLELDAPIATWFLEFPNADTITVDDLLRMRSGIWDSWADEALIDYYNDPLSPPGMEEKIARSAAKTELFTHRAALRPMST